MGAFCTVRKTTELTRSRWLPTAAVRGSNPGLVVGFCGGQSGDGAGFLRVLRFPLPIFIPPIAPKIIIYHRGLYNRPKRPQYQGLRYLGTQSHPTNNKKKYPQTSAAIFISTFISFIYNLFNDANDSEGAWKKAVVAYSEVLIPNFLRGSEGNHKKNEHNLGRVLSESHSVNPKSMSNALPLKLTCSWRNTFNSLR
jgi:hypothetical protein